MNLICFRVCLLKSAVRVSGGKKGEGLGRWWLQAYLFVCFFFLFIFYFLGFVLSVCLSDCFCGVERLNFGLKGHPMWSMIYLNGPLVGPTIELLFNIIADSPFPPPCSLCTQDAG